MEKYICCGDQNSGCMNSDTYDPLSIICTQCANVNRIFEPRECLAPDGINLATVEIANNSEINLGFVRSVPEKFLGIGTIVVLKGYKFRVKGFGRSTLRLEVLPPQDY